MARLKLPPRPTEADFSTLVAVAREISPSPEDVASLAEQLAASGERLRWPAGSVGAGAADVASTGGPASLSTLLAPLALRALGIPVVKLAVSGRPAGAIDSLGSLSGYRVRLSPDQVHETLDASGYAHFLADDRFAPLDAALFAFRRRVGAVAVPALAAASLLSKKIAVGLARVGLDVRVGPHGNFGTTREEARANSLLFCHAADLLGVEATAFLSSAEIPAQPWIGRGESLVALATVVDAIDPTLAASEGWLAAHSTTCLRMAAVVSGSSDNPDLASPSPNIDPTALADALRVHLEAQGATWDAFLARAEHVGGVRRHELRAAEDGTVEVDLGEIRTALTTLQAEVIDGGDAAFSDPAGVHLLVQPGQHCCRDEPLALVRCEGVPWDSNQATALFERLSRAVRALPFDNGSLATSSSPTYSHDPEVVRA